MSKFRLRIAADESLPRDSTILVLDWFAGPDRQRSTISATEDFLDGLAPSSEARDLFRLAGAVYAVDKLSLRRAAPDAWTRELQVDTPVRGRSRWEAARPAITTALSFLSGDRWTLRFRGGARPVDGETVVDAPDVVCLFSGGLDSLTGAIDLLEEGNRVLLVGHFESGFIGGVQATLARSLSDAYGARVRFRQLRLGPAAPDGLQARPLPESRELTTRARSFLFIAIGLVVASSFGQTVPLYVPENGFIGINVPMVASRVGSLSTRTTHPYFLDRLNEALMALGITNELRNPFRLKTKGEILSECRNPDLLAAAAHVSISCAHPEAARWEGQPPSHCGYCYPCLIRRAALYHVGLDESAHHLHDALTDHQLLDEYSNRGASVRALARGLVRDPRPNDVLRNGPVPIDGADFDGVYRRGRDELSTWLAAGAGAQLRAALGL